MNMLLVYKALGLKAEDVQAMLWDKFADGPYYELISKAYSPKHPVLRHTHYRGKVILLASVDLWGCVKLVPCLHDVNR